MGFLKGLGLTILSILLLLCLSLFGVAFMVKSTVLNPDFVAAQVDELDISALAREILEEQMEGQLPEGLDFLEDAIYEVIDQQEPLLKEEANRAVYAGYDYLLGKTDRLEVTFSLVALKGSLRDSLWQAFSDYLSSDLSELPDELVKPLVDEYYDEFIAEVPEEYLPPELADLPEEELKQYIDEYYDEFVGELPEIYLPPEIVSTIEIELEPYFDEFYNEFAGEMPDEYSFDESSIPPDVMQQINLARQYISYFNTGYYVLIALMVLLAAGIVLINRNVKDSCRTLGIDLIVYGALEFAALYLARNVDAFGQFLSMMEVPASLQPWVEGLINGLLAPLQWFAVVTLAAGVVLLAVSFVYRRQAEED
jgi:hypothetical protein